ncbi:MAG: pantetheine-phosphate adenylyltransferase [Legionellales bacterium]|nr:pantetheine-phosphate adenylyltransferase [Legionellales bacterium]HAG61793.1 pantetheine-phosphate adenylyltransferase [Coxiellaceae bacterium]
MKTAIFPGTFDPVTKGHEDLIARAVKLCDRLIVGVATSARKAPHFVLDDRLAMCQLAFSQFDSVDIVPVSGLLVDCAREHGAEVIVRGLRAVSDFDYEFQLAGMNDMLAPDIETVFLPSTQEYAYLSATMVREILMLERDPSLFLSPVVFDYIQALS